jgi:hypothetical protein
MFQLLYWGSITAVSYLGMLAVVASMAGTGISSLAVLLLARNIKLSRRAVIAVISLTLVLTGLLAYFPPIASKLNLEYFRALLEIMFVAYDNFLANFTVAEIVWGTNKFGTEYNPGVTHDWAYFDIFYEYGLVGLFSYLLVYFFVIFNALPRRFSGSLRLLIILFFFGINFHYSALNYFPGQMLFGILGAIGYYLKITKDSAQKSSLPTRA